LSSERWDQFIGHALSAPSLLNLRLVQELTEAIAGSDSDRRVGIVRGLRRAGEILLAIESRHFSNQEVVALLLAALGLLALEDSPSPASERLFMLSLPGLMVADQSRPVHPDAPPMRIPGLEVLEAVAPLLDRVPSSRLQRSIEAGLASDVPEVRACCRLLAALVRVEPPKHTHAT
jgi:hypothetical protein